MDQGCRGSCSHNNNSSNNHSDNSFPKIPDKEDPRTRARTRPDPEAGAGERARQKSHEIRAEDKVAGAHGPTRWIHEEQLQQRRNEEDELQQQQQDADQHQLAVQQYQNYYCPTGKSCCCYVQSPSRTSRTSPSPRPGAGLRPTGGDGEEGEPETEWTKAGSRGPAASAAMNKCLSTSSVTGGGGGNNNNGGNDEDEEIAPVTSLNTSTTMATTTTTRVTTTSLRAAASGSRGIWSAGKAFVRPSNHGPTDWDLERGAGPAECPWCVLRAPRSEGQLLAHLTQGHGAPVAHYHGAFGARVRVRLMHSKSPVPCLSLAGAGPAEEKFFLARIPLPATTTTPSTPATPPPATPAPSPSPSQSPSTTKTSTTSASTSTSTSFSPSSAPSPAASISAASPGAPRTSAHPSACAAPLQYAVFLWHLNALPAAAPRRFETIIESGRTGVRWFGLAHPLSTSWPRIRAEGHFLLHSPARRAREVIDVAPAGVGALADDEDEFFDFVIRIK